MSSWARICLALMLGLVANGIATSTDPDAGRPRARDLDERFQDVLENGPNDAPAQESIERLEFLFTMQGTAAPGQIAEPSAIAAGPDGSIYVADAKDHRILHLGQDGELLASWGSFGSGDGQLAVPGDIAVAPDGSVVVADSANFRIQRFDPEGRLIERWGERGRDVGQFAPSSAYYHNVGPTELAIGESGQVYVNDPGLHRVQVFSPDGRHLRTWTYSLSELNTWRVELIAMTAEPGGTILLLLQAQHSDQGAQLDFLRRVDGKGAIQRHWPLGGLISNPKDVAVSRDGAIYVLGSSIEGPDVVHLDSEGRRVGAWGFPENRPLKLSSASAITVLPNGKVFVAVGGRDRSIHRYGADGQHEARMAQNRIGPGQLWPRSLTVTGNGDLFVAHDDARLFRFDSNGEWLSEWDHAGDGSEEYRSLFDLAAGPDGRVYAADPRQHRVHVFESDGSLVTSWGERGSEIGQLLGPRQLTVTDDGQVLVYESSNSRIQRFSLAGEPNGLWASVRGIEDLEMIATKDESGPKVASIEGGCLVRRSLNGSLISRWNAKAGWSSTDCSTDGAMSRPDRAPSGPESIPIGLRAVTRALDGSYIATGAHTFTQLDAEGEIRHRHGGIGIRNEEFLDAVDVATMPGHLDADAPIPPGAIVIADTENARLQVYGQRRPLWRVEVFDNAWLAGYPARITTTRALDLRWSTDGTGLVAPAADFSARIDRKLTLTDRQRIHLTVEGGARMWLGDELLVDAWQAESVQAVPIVARPAGDWDLRVEIRGKDARAAVRLEIEALPTTTPGPPTATRVPPNPTPRAGPKNYLPSLAR